MIRFNIHTYILDMIKEMNVLKKSTSTLKVKTQLNQQSQEDSDSVYIGSNPVSPAIKSTTYAFRQNRVTSTNIHIFVNFKGCN
jgi:protein subunit release factor A